MAKYRVPVYREVAIVRREVSYVEVELPERSAWCVDSIISQAVWEKDNRGGGDFALRNCLLQIR